MNYKSAKDISIPLKPLNVLIGPNGCGKSNFIDMFSLLTAGAKGELEDAVNRRGGFDSVFFKGKTRSKTTFGFKLHFPLMSLMFAPPGSYLISFDIFLSNPWDVLAVEYERAIIIQDDKEIKLMERNVNECLFLDESSTPLAELTEKDLQIKTIDNRCEFAISQIKDKTSYQIPYSINEYLGKIAVYPPLDVSPDAVIRRPQLVRSGTRLVPSGANLFSVLYSIQQNHPDIWEEIIEILRSVYNDFSRITFPAEGGDGKIILRWWEKPFKEFGFSPSYLSDGTIRLLFLLALLKSPAPPPLICIDEPTVGLHPDWIKLVGELLEEASTRTQLIVATHSAELVSKLKPENVLICEKEDGGTVMERLDEKELSKWLEEYSLGDLWLSGHFGG